MRSLRWQSAVIFVLGLALLCPASNARADLTDLYVALGAGGGHPNGGVDIFKTDGTHVSTLVADGSGGIFDPIQPLFGPDGRLYVTNFGSTVKVYNGITGAFIKDVGSGLHLGAGLAFDASGFLYAADFLGGSVEKIDVGTGVVVHTYSGFSEPIGLLFDPSGHLLVANFNGSDIVSLDTATGATNVFTNLSTPDTMAYGPDGRIYIDANTQIAVVAATGGAATPFATIHDQGAGGLAYADGAFFVSVDDGFRGFDAKTGADIGFHPTGDHNTTRLTVRHPLGPGGAAVVPEGSSLALLVGGILPAAALIRKKRRSRR